MKQAEDWNLAFVFGKGCGKRMEHTTQIYFACSRNLGHLDTVPKNYGKSSLNYQIPNKINCNHSQSGICMSFNKLLYCCCSIENFLFIVRINARGPCQAVLYFHCNSVVCKRQRSSRDTAICHIILYRSEHSHLIDWAEK